MLQQKPAGSEKRNREESEVIRGSRKSRAIHLSTLVTRVSSLINESRFAFYFSSLLFDTSRAHDLARRLVPRAPRSCVIFHVEPRDVAILRWRRERISRFRGSAAIFRGTTRYVHFSRAHLVRRLGREPALMRHGIPRFLEVVKRGCIILQPGTGKRR